MSSLSKRCEEEIGLVKEEMKRLVSFILKQISLIDQSVSNPDIPLNAGLIACLKKKRMIHSNNVCSLVRLWRDILDIPIEFESIQTFATFSGTDHKLIEENSEEQNESVLLDEEDEIFF